MKSALLFLWLLAVSVVVQSAAQAAESDDGSNASQLVAQRYVLILRSCTGIREAHRHALSISCASKVRFSLRGMVDNKKGGLVLSDNDPDGIYAGCYVSRGYNTERLQETGEKTEFLSLERSEAYEGFRRGYYILVGGIYDDSKEAAKVVARFTPIVADAYAGRTKIYKGCIH